MERTDLMRTAHMSIPVRNLIHHGQTAERIGDHFCAPSPLPCENRRIGNGSDKPKFQGLGW